jgi:DNA-binding CsgD family transcriptional regulator
VALVGRDAERETLERLVEGARDGSSGVLVLVGEAGVGKSALLDDAAANADGVDVLRVAGVLAEKDHSYAALHRLLRPHLDELRRLPGPQQDALGSVFGLDVQSSATRFVVGLATLTLLSNLATERPVLCVVDDVDWIDDASLDALAIVARRIMAERLVFLFAGRQELGPLEDLPVLVVDGLDDDDARRLLESGIEQVAAPVAARVLAETRGNPLALIEVRSELTPEELAGRVALPESLPVGPRLEARFVSQWADMPAATRLLLLLVTGGPRDLVELEEIARIVGTSLDAAQPAEDARLVTLHPGLAFRHPMIGSAIYAAAPLSDRRRMHRAFADVIDPDRDPERFAWHLAKATIGPDEEVARELQRCATLAQKRGGTRSSVELLVRAAELTADPEQRSVRLVQAAMTATVAGAMDRASDLLEEGLPGLQAPFARAQANWLSGVLQMSRGDFAPAPARIMRAAVELEPMSLHLGSAAMFDAVTALCITGPHANTDTREQILAMARAMSKGEREGPVDLMFDAYTALLEHGLAKVAPQLRHAATVWSASELTSDDVTRWCLPPLWVALDLWDGQLLRALLDRMLPVARAQGATLALHAIVFQLTIADLRDGRFGAAEASALEARDVADMIGGRADQSGAAEVELLAWQGDESRTRATAGTVRTAAVEQGDYTRECMANIALAVLDNALGAYSAALDAASRVDFNIAPGFGGRALPELIEAAVRSGDDAAARSALEELDARAEASGTREALGLRARCHALVASGDEADSLYRESIEQLGRTSVATALARSQLLYGEWLRREKRRSDARVQLRGALDLFTAMGANAFAERTRLEIAATGERARRRRVDTTLILTPRENQVARLASTGFTNAEVAAQLFLSGTTVEYHLRNVYRKLAITSRRQLADVLPQ